MSGVKRMKKGAAHTGDLAPGCVVCEKGSKLVLLVTGRCLKRCLYCPLSSAKKGRDVFYANERRIRTVREAIEEARLIDALGTGITGGDPLLAIDRTLESIRGLKRHFGKDHHIHLYTSTTDGRRIARVARAGLDEIRFHPPIRIWTRLDRSPYKDAVRLCERNGMTTGMEVPVLPGKEDELEGVIGFADRNELDFVNLNELEFSETNWRALRSIGFDVRDDVSAGVAGSEALAKKLLRMDVDVPLHYCSSAFKDGVQLRKRIGRRAKNVRRPHEIITHDSTLLKGVIETPEPSEVARLLKEEFEVPGRLIWIDREKRRLEVAPWVLEEIAPELGMECYIVEEYPTADRLEVERAPLRRR